MGTCCTKSNPDETNDLEAIKDRKKSQADDGPIAGGKENVAPKAEPVQTWEASDLEEKTNTKLTFCPPTFVLENEHQRKGDRKKLLSKYTGKLAPGEKTGPDMVYNLEIT